MTVYLATRTLQAIDEALERDQGATFRYWLEKVLPHIGDAYSTNTFPFRGHLGASMLGRECGREIWLGWRWATLKKQPGRMLRLFNRGHLEEGRFIALLLMIGCQVMQQDENGKQFRIKFGGGHGGGSGDGMCDGIPDLATGTRALLEFKTHNEKSFKELQKKGVKEAKPEHYTQMQTYMRKMGLAVALYGAVCKNNDDLHLEIIVLDERHADIFLSRGEALIACTSAPEKLKNANPGFWSCKWCDQNAVCHGLTPPHKNCRTCQYGAPIPDEGWKCLRDPKNPVQLTEEMQFNGCNQYQRHGGI